MAKKYVSESKMDKKLKAKWVKALRSGKFKQARSCLERLDYKGNPKGNCCLGVLCRISKIRGHKDLYRHFTLFDDCDGYLSEKLLKRFGLTQNDQKELAQLNDGMGYTKIAKSYSFKRIADFIEKNIGVKKAA